MSGQLDCFCRIIQSEYDSPAGISPDDMASEFVSHSSLSSLPGFTELHTALRRYGVGDITPADLSAGKLKGHHFSYRGASYTVLYDRELWQGSIEHVMLHELYEIICEKCERICSDYRVPPVPRICSQANRFAAAVLMQPGIFLTALLETGLDLVGLHHRFQKSYSSVAIRAVEVLNERNRDLSFDERIDLMVAIYERVEEGKPNEWGPCCPDGFVVTYAPRTQGFRPGLLARRSGNGGPRYMAHLLPQRGDGVSASSIAFKVIQNGRCHYLNRLSGFDLWGDSDLAFIAQPVWWFGHLAKVILVGVRAKDGHLLDVQVDGLNPLMVSETCQEI